MAGAEAGAGACAGAGAGTEAGAAAAAEEAEVADVAGTEGVPKCSSSQAKLINQQPKCRKNPRQRQNMLNCNIKIQTPPILILLQANSVARN